jgi:hypothetical protein
MSQTTYSRIERVIIGLMLIGIVGMFQPLGIALFRYGFLTLLFSTLLFIIISHLSPRSSDHELSGPVTPEQAIKHAQGHDQ